MLDRSLGRMQNIQICTPQRAIDEYSTLAQGDSPRVRTTSVPPGLGSLSGGDERCADQFGQLDEIPAVRIIERLVVGSAVGR